MTWFPLLKTQQRSEADIAQAVSGRVTKRFPVAGVWGRCIWLQLSWAFWISWSFGLHFPAISVPAFFCNSHFINVKTESLRSNDSPKATWFVNGKSGLKLLSWDSRFFYPSLLPFLTINMGSFDFLWNKPMNGEWFHRPSIKRNPDSPCCDADIFTVSRCQANQMLNPGAKWVPAGGWTSSQGRQWAAQEQGAVWASARKTITD